MEIFFNCHVIPSYKYNFSKEQTKEEDNCQKAVERTQGKINPDIFEDGQVALIINGNGEGIPGAES